jgi:hypothetical protein
MTFDFVRGAFTPAQQRAVHSGPYSATIGPMANVELERVEVLELLGLVLAHLNDAEARREMSARVPMLMGIRDKLAASLQEDQ